MQRRDFVKMLCGLPFIGLGAKAPSPGPTTLLLETPVAGFRYHAGERAWPRMHQGDPVALVREPDNPHDDKAVAVFWQGAKLGYIPRADNTVIANLLDQGALVGGRIQAMHADKQPWERLEIRIQMKAY